MAYRAHVWVTFCVVVLCAGLCACGASRRVGHGVTLEAPFLVVLGIAQDGGVPQAGSNSDPRWRDESRRRLVSCLGLVDPVSMRRWLFDATPDLPEQLARLHADCGIEAGKAPDGIFLTHAHIGHYAGLMFLGHEAMGARGVKTYAAPRMRTFLASNGPWDQLVRYKNIDIEEMTPGQPVDLGSGLRVTPFLVPHRQEYSEVVGFRIDGPGASALFIPDIDSWNDFDAMGVRIEDLIANVDVAYLDGTFFGDGELPGRDMKLIPHPMITTSVARFAALSRAERAKVRFIHLNHTNPALDENSPAAKFVRRAGMSVAREGEVVSLGTPRSR